MKRVLVATFAAGAAAAAVASAAQQAGFLPLPRAAAAGEQTLYGHIRSVTPSGGRYVLRLDPALSLSGMTANRAAAADGAVPPGQPVPNDVYVVDESHRTYAFFLPRSARVTVLTNDGSGIRSTAVGVDELARIVRGHGPHVRLFEPLASGVWVRFRIDTIRSIDQQYQP